MSVKQLWAPWRMEYITDAAGKKTGDCTLCRVYQSSDDRKNLILFRGEVAYVILNRYPYNNGHLMIVPNRHTDDYLSLSDKETHEMSSLLKHGILALTQTYHPEGFNLGMNLGRAAGAGIKYHLHEHIVPRWTGDSNFLPVLGEVRSMPQHLTDGFDLLYEYFRRL